MAQVAAAAAAPRKLYDVLIVGGGPAGLSMAVGLARQVYSALVLDSGEYRNARAAHMHTVPGFDHADPASFRGTVRRDLRARYASVEFRAAKVTQLRRVQSPRVGGTVTADTAPSAKEEGEDGARQQQQQPQEQQQEEWLFEATDEQGNVYAGRKLGLATGVRDVFPADVPGYEACWGRGVFHCMFCHGFEERGAASAGVLAGGLLAGPEMLAHVTPMVKRLARSVTVYTNGDEALAEAARAKLRSGKIRFDTRRIARIAMAEHQKQQQQQQEQEQEQKEQQEQPQYDGGGDSTAVTLYFEDGTAATEGFVANHPAVEQRAAGLVRDLGLQLGPAGEVLVREGPGNQAAGVDGCFVAGDMATPIRTVVKAMEMGTFAAAGMVMTMNAELDARDEL
ncbi:thioredoxin reductase GliT [Purpureocillium lavendulum]|uniref:Thioredoxin reductase GliT n=1 Tax=Purpureocillium lavendulum TaxID=1247861 RepID=A0AB34G883_9HYPO|nr:thioredoxin reductase GliT [Purpureocillium lavendulum]